MNIAELLEFVNLLKKKLNYAGSNVQELLATEF